MKDAQKPDHVSLNTLVERLRDGRYVIPDFQREFEWKPWDINDLMRSIFLDYYIGSLLLWSGKKGNFEALSCEPVYGFAGNQRPEHIVLDGQQRLTAMYYAFFAPDTPLPNRANRYFFYLRVDHFMAEEFDVAFEYDWAKYWNHLIHDRDYQYSHHIFPLAVIGENGWALANWVQEYEKFWREKADGAQLLSDGSAAKVARMHADNAHEFGLCLRGITEQYQVSYIELDQDLGIEKVCDIFTKINSKGVQLDTFDLINAMLKPKGLKLKQMWREAAPRLEFVETSRMNTYILQVMSILRQAYCSPKYLYFLLPGQEKPIRDPDGGRHKEILVPTLDDFRNGWNEAVQALERSIKMLKHPQEFGAIKSSFLPYESILPAFAALQCYVSSLLPHCRLDGQRKVRHWYWASVFTNRYSGSVESTAARDFLDLKAWLDDDASEPDLIREFELRASGLDLRKEVKRGSSVYNGIFNLLIIQGARDWMTGTIPQYDELDDHHIIPASKANELGLGGSINSILNRTPMTAETNRLVIGDRWPSEYLPELMARNSETTVRSVLESHFISPAALAILLRAPFSRDDFDAFVTERNRTLVEAIENLLIKERLDLSPQLRELDQRIEAIELGLREKIDQMLGSDPSLLPSNYDQKAEERIQSARKKNPGMDLEPFRMLLRRLEFLDLRDLEDVLKNKSLWVRFEVVFAHKEQLQIKFGQLAELRNGIRHTRSVDEITRKEGEAAILWFEQILRR